ncbi:MAG: hypothetical protein HY689_09255 [Chloroflexi bacterium]|nr:hypothetical protein [Chloroflexota bacterium]
MEEFLQTYGTWIVAGLFFLFMLFMHGGHGMDHGQHGGQRPPRSAGTDDETDERTAGGSRSRGSGGCH